MHTLLAELQQKGWQISTCPPVAIPPVISRRFPTLPPEYTNLFSDISVCVNSRETTWLITPSNLRGTTDSAFAWNEFESQSLEAAGSDSKWRYAISVFWDRHFPICQSVADGYYQYAAISLVPDSYGQIVVGSEPEYEEIEIVANDLNIFVQTLN